MVCGILRLPLVEIGLTDLPKLCDLRKEKWGFLNQDSTVLQKKPRSSLPKNNTELELNSIL